MVVRKFFKKSLIEEYRISGELNGHIVSFGKIGSGKTVSLLSILQGFHDAHEYKIFDLYGGERNEGLYWGFPNTDKQYWETLRLNLGTFSEDPAKQYKINYLYPFFDGKIPNKLPIKKISGEIVVNSKLFTIPISDIDISDIRMVLGNVAETNKYIWEETQLKIKKTDTCEVLEFLSKELGGSNTTIYRNFIKPMIRAKLLMSNKCDLNVDILSEVRNKEAITVLCLDFVPEKFHMFIINYILKKMMNYLDLGKTHKRNIIFMRELGTFFRASDDSILEERFKIFRTQLAHYMRMGRRGMYFAGDCQSAAEVKSVVQGSEDYMIMHHTTSWRDKEEMTQELIREKRMRADQKADLGNLNPGEAYIAETGKVVKKVKVLLPRTMYWKKEYPNFYRVMWEKYGGEWKEMSDKIDYVRTLCKENVKELMLKQKEKQELQEEKKGRGRPKTSMDDVFPEVIAERSFELVPEIQTSSSKDSALTEKEIYEDF